MRIIIITFLLLFVFSTVSYAQEKASLVGVSSKGGSAVYDEELREFYTAGIGLLLDEGQEALLKDLEDNSKILRGGETYSSQNTLTVDVDEAFRLYSEKNYEQAFKKMLDIARTGNVDAQEAVGLMLFNGWGVAQDMKQAARWFKRASRKLKPLSLHYLGTMYFKGAGVKKDIIKAAMWLNLAVKFYDDNSDTKKRATEDLENILARISLREQRSVQSKVEEWINKHSATVNAFNRIKKIMKEKAKIQDGKKYKEQMK